MMKLGTAVTFLLAVIGLYISATSVAYAEWETGMRGGYNSNIDHSIKDPESDSYVSGYISYAKGIAGESRLNWTFDASLEGAGYLSNNDLSYGQLTLAPAMVWFLRHNWMVSISPFLEGKIVRDSDQSALTLGGKVALRERPNQTFYFSQFYLYRNSMASSNVYSTWEHVLGAVVGANWTKRFFTEVGYEFSHGESFRSMDGSKGIHGTGSSDGGGGGGGASGGGGGGGETSAGGNGGGQGTMRGHHGKYSSAFDTEVFQEIVDRHAIGITFGVDWTKSLFSTAGYTYSTMKGDSGTSHEHAGFLSLGYRF